MSALRCCGALLALIVVSATSHATVNNRLLVVNQSDFDKKVGFVLDFENDAPDGQACQVGTLKAHLGVADGKNWHYLTAGSAFHIGETVHLRATITGTDATLDVNGETDHNAYGYVPSGPSATAAEVPAWASGECAYRLVEESATVRVGGTAHPFSFPSNLFSPAMLLFENPVSVTRSIEIKPGQTVLIDAVVRIEPLLDAAKYKPLIDRFGQVVQAQFQGKIESLTALRKAFAADDRQLNAWKPRTDVDAFGGQLNVAWAQKGTGFFRSFKRGGVWWLLSPLGNPLFYTGVCSAPALQWDCTPVTGREDLYVELPPKEGPKPSLWSQNVWGTPDSAYALVHGMNLIRRFGADNYDAAASDECKRRLASWGFSGLGKWSDQKVAKTPILPVISAPGVPKIDRHFDVFDPVVRAKLRSVLDAQLRRDLKSPYILGYSFGNEYDEIIEASEAAHILASTTPSPAKLAFIDYALTKLYGQNQASLRSSWGAATTGSLGTQSLTVPATDLEPLRRFYATRYYSTLYSTFKSVDPNHLYFGFWIVPGWWVSDEDWNLVAPYVDVIGFDRYSKWPGIENLLTRFDKPVLLGEFSFPSWYGGARGFGRYSIFTDSDEESGREYAALVGAAANCPQCVGALWFQYRDEPILGRGPVTGKSVTQGEHYAFGLIDACDLPKYDLVKQVRLANLAANESRLKVTH